MTIAEKLEALRAAVQVDVGQRGLARDPHDNLFTTFAGDFAAVCHSLADTPNATMDIATGFLIPTASPPRYETDGPLGAVFLVRALSPLLQGVRVLAESGYHAALLAGLQESGIADAETFLVPASSWRPRGTHLLAIERVGPAGDGQRYSMRGIPLTAPEECDAGFGSPPFPGITIGIGDGGNEIGMGKIPHDTIVANIPNGKRIHCRVATDRLIVAGVSNWGAYALAAGVYLLRGIAPPANLFDPARERDILHAMVRLGNLIDGVSGQPTATVDGLTWDEYIEPMVKIGHILGA